MSRVAFIADIHGNLPALEAVLDDIASCEVTETVVAGDMVGRGPQGSEVIARLREVGLRSVRGNHEDYLLSFRRKEVPESWLDAPEWSCSRWMADQLSSADIEFIDSLPFSMTSESDSRLRIVHGSPDSYNEGLGKWLDDSVLREHFEAVEEPVLVCAHTHRPAQWRFDDGLVVNVGSVGLPFNGDTRAQYAILVERFGSWDVEFRQVDYDRDQLLETYRTSGFLDEGGATAQLLRYEVEHARPFLVPFLKWSEARKHPPVISYLDEFLDFFDEELSLAELFGKLEALKAHGSK